MIAREICFEWNGEINKLKKKSRLVPEFMTNGDQPYLIISSYYPKALFR